LARAQQSAAETPAAPSAEAPVEQTPEPTAEEPAVQAETPPAQASDAQPPRPAAAPAPAEPEGPSLIDRLIEFWWIPVLLGLGLIGALAFLRRRREQSDLGDLPVVTGGGDDFSFEPRADRTKM